MGRQPFVFPLQIHACDTKTSTQPTTSADPELVEAIVSKMHTGCMEAYEVQSPAEQNETLSDLNRIHMTLDTYCECTAQTFLSNASQDEINELMTDILKYEEGIAEYEPWKRRIKRAVAHCSTGNWSA